MLFTFMGHEPSKIAYERGREGNEDNTQHDSRRLVAKILPKPFALEIKVFSSHFQAKIYIVSSQHAAVEVSTCAAGQWAWENFGQ